MKRLIGWRCTFVVLAIIAVVTFSSASSGTASAQIRCDAYAGTCPQEYAGCASCSGGWKVKWKNYNRYDCTDGSYICQFTGYSYGACGTCYL